MYSIYGICMVYILDHIISVVVIVQINLKNDITIIDQLLCYYNCIWVIFETILKF